MVLPQAVRREHAVGLPHPVSALEFDVIGKVRVSGIEPYLNTAEKGGQRVRFQQESNWVSCLVDGVLHGDPAEGLKRNFFEEKVQKRLVRAAQRYRETVVREFPLGRPPALHILEQPGLHGAPPKRTVQEPLRQPVERAGYSLVQQNLHEVLLLT
jgi:hypothetical protein